MGQAGELKIRFLGDVAVEKGGRNLALPQSRKTRALLAYLALTGRPQRRDRLCTFFWDVTDDPRGALRWSLSRLRPLVDTTKKQRLVADRDHVSFDLDGVWIDVCAVRECAKTLSANPPVETLEATAELFRGEFLEGLELPGFDDFQAWCVGEREQNRRIRARILAEIVNRHSSDHTASLPYARSWVQADPLNETAHAALVRLLVLQSRTQEARQQYESALRMLKEAGLSDLPELHQAWQAAKSTAGAASVLQVVDRSLPVEAQASVTLVGRAREVALLRKTAQETRQLRRESVLLVSGEPGIGKTRLLFEAQSIARECGATILDGAAFEAESSRPYGPWIDALSKLPPVIVGSTLSADLAALVPELSPGSPAPQTKDQMFGAVVELIAARAHSSGLVVLALDDMQWCDNASAELLHYVIRSNRHRPLLVLLAARSGELQDNMAMVRVLRSLRREHKVQQVAIDPLNLEETRELAAQIDPSLKSASGLSDTSGNPLFVLELARSILEGQEGTFSQDLVGLVRDRVENLQPPCPEILAWGAVAGSTITPELISQLGHFEPAAMMHGFEALERHGLILATGMDATREANYRFAHDLVRKVVYTSISEPRRRIMHGRVARLLAKLQDGNESIMPDVVHHAALANDAVTAARACVAAGKRCLRLFANDQAETFAKRGKWFAEQVPQPEQVKLLIELAQIEVRVRRATNLEDQARELERLAELALDHGCMAHARLAFHVSSYLRWEGGDWSVAERDTLRAELISRVSDPRDRMTALAEAARCLTMLERDLGRASSLLMEATQLADKMGVEDIAIPIAEGLIHEHEGRYPHAVRLFLQALELARRDRDWENEFSALEHLVRVRIDQEEYLEAVSLAEQLAAIAEKLREGSEAPFARVLLWLARYAAAGKEDAGLEQALADLRASDAKHRLAFSLTRIAAVDLKHGRMEWAERRACEALKMAEIVARPSEMALARSLLGQVLIARREYASAQENASLLAQVDARSLSNRASQAVAAFQTKVEEQKAGGSDGTGRRRKVLRGAR